MTLEDQSIKPDILLAAALDLAGRGWRIIPVHDLSVGLCNCCEAEAPEPSFFAGFGGSD